MANVNSKFFDDIRITKKKEDRKKTNQCQWDSCDEVAVHKKDLIIISVSNT